MTGMKPPNLGCHPIERLPRLSLNTAIVKIVNYVEDTIVSFKPDACPDCAWRDDCSLTGNGTALLVDSLFPGTMRVSDGNAVVCEKNVTFLNQAEYSFDVTKCEFVEAVAGDNPLIASTTIAVGLLILLFGHDFYLNITSGWWSAQEDHDEFYFGNVPTRHSTKRLLSVSVLRGLSVAMMAFVNTMGGSLHIFLHAEWDGLNVADFVFPSFLFCAGLSSQIALAYKSRFDFVSFAKRMMYLTLIGIFIVNGGSDWRTLRIMGVLQRLAICQLILYPLQVWQNKKQEELVTLRETNQRLSVKKSTSQNGQCMSPNGKERIEKMTAVRRRRPAEESEVNRDDYDDDHGGQDQEELVNGEGTAQSESQPSMLWKFFGEWRFISAAVGATAVINAIVFALRYIPLECCPSGYTGPGGLSSNGSYANCSGGIYGFVDRVVLGKHIYKASPCKSLYDCVNIDPEGILSTAGALINVAIGIHVAQILRWYKSRKDQYDRLFLYAALYLLFGLFLHSVAPINKQLWSISFALVTSAVSQLIFLLIRWSADHVTTNVKLRALAYLGDNALLVYILQEAFSARAPYQFYVGYSHLAWALLALWTVFVSIATGFVLRDKGIKFRL